MTSSLHQTEQASQIKKSRVRIFPALLILMGGKRYCQPEKRDF
jgi:hypothetical protein